MFTSDLIKLALTEDVGERDATSEAVIPENQLATGVVVAKEEMIVAGLGVAGGVFATTDPTLHVKQRVADGTPVRKGTAVMDITGKCRSLLRAERVALNFLQRLCGIATLTHQYVAQTKGTKTKILDTRKTSPLLRHLDKYAVRMGGGRNHRFGLYDGIMLKDNHIAAMSGSIEQAVKKAKKQFPDLKIIVEITSIDQIEAARRAQVDRILLDNMSNAQIGKALKKIKGELEVEVSGGITLSRVRSLSKMGVDYISVGALTHSVRAADLSLEINHENR
jgi:nicotinate-nucleotide pyrophosphorylase (carboxylating)